MAVDKLVDSAQLESGLTDIADAIRVKTGKSESIEFPDGFVNEIESIGGGKQPITQFGYYFKGGMLSAQVIHNHVRVEYVGGSGSTIALNGSGSNFNFPEWFKINAGSTVTITYKNVINPNNKIWNANLKKANTTTSLQYGIGDDPHLNGAIITVVPTVDQSIGCFFIYAPLSSGDYIEFDIEITIDGVRYI